ncbi:hypothetical protein MKEN_00399300 [Mycena kentingensis (nom. inval.)]|nr:hypothetical protein MKEN_00399300 [Mycena kentingensis (nom. inval.)]
MDTIAAVFGQYEAPVFEKEARALLADAKARLVQVEAQIATLLHVRDRERARVAALHLVVSPVRMLPAELLAGIFLLVAREKQLREAVRLASVCAYWRRVALETPRLWTTEAGIDFAVTHVSPAKVELAEALFKRAAPHSLRVAIREPWLLRREPKAAASPNLPAMLETCAAYMSQWSSLETNWKGTVALFQDICTPLLRLRVLTLKHDADPEPVLKALSHCVSLVKLTLDMRGWTEPEDVFEEPMITLSELTEMKLQELELGDADVRRGSEATFQPFFARLACPRLKTLAVAGLTDMDKQYSFSDAFPDFLGRSRRLEDLTIEWSTMDDQDLARILQNIPSLVSLRIEYCWQAVGDAFFEALTYRPHSAHAPLAPRLQSIHMYCIGEGDDEHKISAMVLSRWWADEDVPTPAPRVARWREIYIGAADDGRENDDVSEGFKAMRARVRAEGLEFTLNHYGPCLLHNLDSLHGLVPRPSLVSARVLSATGSLQTPTHNPASVAVSRAVSLPTRFPTTTIPGPAHRHMDPLAILLTQSASSDFEPHAKTLLAATEANLAQTESRMKDLAYLAERDRSLISTLKLVFAPVWKLPAEPLVHIFRDTVDIGRGGDLKSHTQTPFALRSAGRSELHAVLRLCGVCPAWRRLILRTPRLWTMQLPVSRNKSGEYAALLNVVLDRSSPFAVPVHIQRDLSPAVVEALFRVAPRWRSFLLEQAGFDKLDELPVAPPLPLLEAVSLNDEHLHNSSIFQYCPRLVAVCLYTAHARHLPMHGGQ